MRNIQRLCNVAVHTGLQCILTVFFKGVAVIAKMGMPAFAASGRARICALPRNRPSWASGCPLRSIVLPGGRLLHLLDAISPSSAVSTAKPASFRISSASSRFKALSSTSKSFFPLSSAASGCAGLQAGSAPYGSASTLCSSERNSGFSQKAVTPAARASSSISVQS